AVARPEGRQIPLVRLGQRLGNQARRQLDRGSDRAGRLIDVEPERDDRRRDWRVYQWRYVRRRYTTVQALRLAADRNRGKRQALAVRVGQIHGVLGLRRCREAVERLAVRGLVQRELPGEHRVRHQLRTRHLALLRRADRAVRLDRVEAQMDLDAL